MTTEAAPVPFTPRKRRSLLMMIALGIGALVALILLGLVLLLAFFPKGAAIAEIERQVEASTERDLTMSEDISFTLWPALGFTANDVALSNPEGYPEQPFVTTKRVVFAVALMPLFRGDVQVRRLYLEEPQLALIAKADGHGNWEFPVTENQQQLDSLRLEDVRISKGRFSFQGAEGAPLVFDDVNTSLAIHSLEDPLEAKGDFRFRDEKLNFTALIGSPHAVLEQEKTPLRVEITSPLVNATFDGTADAMSGALEGSLNASGQSARRVFAWQGSPMPAGPGFGAFSARGRMARAEDTLRITGGRFALDAIRASGNITVVTAPSGFMTISGALSVPTLDFNPYLPEQGEGVETSAAWPTDPIDLSGLKAANVNLDLTIGALHFQKMEFSDARMALRIQHGVADARLSRINLYSGGGTARIVADGRQRAARIATEIDVQNVQALPLLTAAIGLDKLEGRGRLRASLIGRGASQAEIMRSLGGTASFNFEDGRWKGVNLGQMASALSALQNRGNAQMAQGSATEFSMMSATFNVVDGVASTQDMRIVTPVMPISATGLINIGAQTFDLRFNARDLPLRASGPWARPQFGLDSQAAGAILRTQVQEQARRALQRNNLGDLGALFGLGPATPVEQPAPAQAETPPQTDAQAPAADAPAQQQAETPAAAKTPEEQLREQARDALGGLFRRN